jgi:Planctomycete cytochrome C
MTRVVVFALAVSATAQNAPKGEMRFFDTRVAPILTKRCLPCHNNELNDGDISFLDRATLIKGGSRGPAVVPGNPDASVLVHAIRQDGELKMPPGGKLSPHDIATLTEWIRRGAAWGTKLTPPAAPPLSKAVPTRP